MKALLLLPALVAVACADTSSKTDPLGGQTGDDGDLLPSEPGPGEDPGSIPAEPNPGPEPGIDPGVPWIDDCGYQERALDVDEPSVFGADASELLQRLDSGSPIFWVPFDALPGTTYAPGPGDTTLSIDFELNGDEEVVQWGPPTDGDDGERGTCQPEVRVPVWVDLSTADGALSEHFAATLYFHSGATAELNYDLPAADIVGGFQITNAGARNPGEQWELELLYIDVQLWPNGSAGRIEPRFTLTESLANDGLTPPPPAMPPATPSVELTPTAGVSGTNFTTPDSWSAVAVWPTREICAGGDVRPLDAAVIGLSALDIIAELNDHDEWTLGSAGASQPLRFSIEQPVEQYYCAKRNGELLTFSVRANARAASGGAVGEVLAAGLAADAGSSTNAANRSDAGSATDAANSDDAGSATNAANSDDAGSADAGAASPTPTKDAHSLAELDATDRFEIRAHADGAALELSALSFTRASVVYSLSRSQLEAALNLSLDVAEEYREFWWDWHGSLVKEDEQWAREARFIVTSLNAEQAAEIAQRVSQGGPGAGIGFDERGLPELPGDVLLDAQNEE